MPPFAIGTKKAYNLPSFSDWLGLKALERAPLIEAQFEGCTERLSDDYKTGPYRWWARQAWKRIFGWFPGLKQGEIARQLNRNPGRIAINAKDGTLTPQVLLAAAERARIYNASLPPARRVQTGLKTLPEEPQGAAYRHHARQSLLVSIDHYLRFQKFVKRGQPDPLLKKCVLPSWQFALLDLILSTRQPQWEYFYVRYNELAQEIHENGDLQNLIRCCVAETAQQPFLSIPHQRALRQLLYPNDAHREACQLTIDLLNRWQRAWLATDFFAQQFEK